MLHSLHCYVRGKGNGATSNGHGADGAGSAISNVNGKAHSAATLATQTGGDHAASFITLGKVFAALPRVQMCNQHILCQQSVDIVILDGNIPNFLLGFIAAVQIPGIEALCLGGFLAAGIGIAVGLLPLLHQRSYGFHQ